MILAGALLALALAGPARAAAPADPELRKQVERLLSGYEPGDPGAALRRLGEPAAAVLLQLAQEDGRPLLRLRAVEALGHVPTAAALAHLQALVTRHQGAGEPAAVYELAAAARALGGYAAAGEKALPALREHDSADVREGAAAGLGRVASDGCRKALTGRLPREKDRGVRAAIERALKR